MNDKLRILLVDDHSMVRKGVRLYLESQDDFQIIGEADSGEVAIKWVEEHAPEVVLMDLMMPGMGGIEATRRIKGAQPNNGSDRADQLPGARTRVDGDGGRSLGLCTEGCWSGGPRSNYSPRGRR